MLARATRDKSKQQMVGRQFWRSSSPPSLPTNVFERLRHCLPAGPRRASSCHATFLHSRRRKYTCTMTKLIHLVAVLGCALVSLAPALAADKDLQAGGMWAKILGQSGKIDLAPSSDVSSNPDKVRIQIEALRQLDKDGAELGGGGNSKHSFNSFATQEFTFSPLEDTTFGGVKCIKLPFSCTLGPGSKIEIQVFIFKEKAPSLLERRSSR